MGNLSAPEEPCGKPSANDGANPHPHQFNVEAVTACTDGFTAAPDETSSAEKKRETVPERPVALLQTVCSRNPGLAPFLFLCGLCFFASLLVFTLESVQYNSQGISGYIFLAGLLLCTLLAPMFLAKRYRLVKTFGLLTPILPFVTTLIGWLPSGESWIFFNLILLAYCWLCLFLFWLFQTKPYLPLAVGLALLPFVMQFLRCQTKDRMIGLLNVDAVFAGYLFICLSLSLVCLGFGIAARNAHIKSRFRNILHTLKQKAEGRM